MYSCQWELSERLNEAKWTEPSMLRLCHGEMGLISCEKSCRWLVMFVIF